MNIRYLLLALSLVACTQPPNPPPKTNAAQITPLDPQKPIIAAFPEGFHNGICYAHAWEDANDGGYGTEKDKQTLQRLKDIGVNWISITPFAFQRKRQSDKISGTSAKMHRAESDDRIKLTAAYAKELGIKVLLKPHVWVGDNSWCGAIQPPDWKVWMESYREVVIHYAKLAQEINADGYLIGNELGTATKADPDGFRELIKESRKYYKGPTSYAANWDEAERIPFWDDLDAIGVNAYWPLTRKKGATEEELYQGALKIDAKLEALSKKTNRAILFTEIGYRSVIDSAVDPNTWPENDQDRQIDYEAQAKAYRAVLKAFSGKSHIRGIYFWKVISDGVWREDGGERGFSPLDKPAEQVLRQYFKQ
jgi:arabinogalactan endo-1,4-beta-galactosidase